jgi:hypothetical protein
VALDWFHRRAEGVSNPNRGKIGPSAAVWKAKHVHVVRVVAIGVHPIRLALVAGFVGLAAVVIILGIWWWTKRK